MAQIFENGIEIEVNAEFVDALCKAQPNKYSKEKPAPKEVLKVADMSKEESKKSGKETPGKFTVEDLQALKFEGIKEICKTLGITIKGKKKEVLIQEIWDKSQKFTGSETK